MNMHLHVSFFVNIQYITGADPGFQVRGGALKKLGGRRENFGVFHVKNHDFTPKNLIFSNFRGGGGARRVRPPGSAPALYDK